MNGPAHAEIKMVKGEPCLVEVGARCHGAEGCWRAVARESHGYDQVRSDGLGLGAKYHLEVPF
jgi:hypothetical protein